MINSKDRRNEVGSIKRERIVLHERRPIILVITINIK